MMICFQFIPPSERIPLKEMFEDVLPKKEKLEEKTTNPKISKRKQ